MTSDITEKVKDFFQPYPLRAFSKGERLLQAEELPAGVFYLTEGRVSQYDITPNGNVVVVNAFKPGAFFPMSSAINNSTNHYFFEASTKAAAYVAPAADVLTFVKDNPDVMFDLLSRVYRGMDGVLRRMAHLMGGDARSRLLFELLNATYRFGESVEGDEAAIFVPLKEGDLAKHSGLARETVNRNLQNMKTQGLVEIRRTGITVKDLSQIEKLLGSGL